ncbi:Outer membrane TonB-dependent transducer VreA of trans-envelope signaling system [plant metagenome]|uniref:Outer membrane TonB-dependent transducer VreA of trans-envelope signaling system n=1 Tax=plant metagenome TaxID=1297885 RepID=A0A484VAV4_9ZZZZ
MTLRWRFPALSMPCGRALFFPVQSGHPMRCFPAPFGVLAVAGACIAGLLPNAAAFAQERSPRAGGHATPHDFQLPALPLGDSLERFSRVTGAAVLIDAREATRPAGPLMGTYTEDEALARLLDGTGLRARRSGISGYVVAPGGPGRPRAADPAGGIPGLPPGDAALRAYVGRVQTALLRGLCDGGPLQSGAYRLALQLRVGDDGRVRQWRLLDSTGDQARDAALARLVAGLSAGAPLPAGLPQPFTILIGPDAQARSADCAALARADR